MKFSFELTPFFHLVTDILLQTVIQIILLSYFAYYQVGSLTPDDTKHWKSLSLAGAVLFLIAEIGTCLLNYKYHKYALRAMFALDILSIFLQLIGMGLGSKQIIDNQYNIPVAYWFMEAMIFILSLINLHTIKLNNEEKQPPKADIPKADPQRQHEPVPNTQANQSQLNMIGNNESQFTQQQQVI